MIFSFMLRFLTGSMPNFFSTASSAVPARAVSIDSALTCWAQLASVRWGGGGARGDDADRGMGKGEEREGERKRNAPRTQGGMISDKGGCRARVSLERGGW